MSMTTLDGGNSPGKGDGDGAQHADPTQHTHATANANAPQASLLGLPAELRNRIYSNVLGEDLLYTVRKGRAKEPVLLLSCSQIRNEARAMWFKQNRFVLLVRNCVFAPHAGHWFWSEGVDSCRRVYMSSEGKPFFDDMLGWIQQYHAGAAPLLKWLHVDQQYWKDIEVGRKVCDKVKELRHLPWEEIVEDIEEMMMRKRVTFGFDLRDNGDDKMEVEVAFDLRKDPAYQAPELPRYEYQGRDFGATFCGKTHSSRSRRGLS